MINPFEKHSLYFSQPFLRCCSLRFLIAFSQGIYFLHSETALRFPSFSADEKSQCHDMVCNGLSSKNTENIIPGPPLFSSPVLLALPPLLLLLAEPADPLGSVAVVMPPSVARSLVARLRSSRGQAVHPGQKLALVLHATTDASY